jgi:hypothetical protein
MKLRIRLVIPILLVLTLIFVPSRVSAHEPHVCPDGFPDDPAFLGHFQQENIVNGEMTFDDIFDAGRVLFGAVFNKCDGQGRPATTGGGEKRSPNEQPSFIRTSAPDSSSCAGCHSQPRVGGGGILLQMSLFWLRFWIP